MTRKTAVSLAATALTTLAGCSSDSGGSPGSLEPLRTISFAFNLQAVSGHGSVVAALDYNGNHQLPVSAYQAILRLGARDPSHPTELLDLGTVVLDTELGVVNDVVVTADWATVTCDATVSAITLTGTPQLVATVAGGGTRAIASGQWLLAADGDALSVRDLADPLAPLVGAAFEAGSAVTGLGLAPDGFYFFTSGGMGHVSMQGGAPAYAYAASDDLRLFSKAVLAGTKLYVGGPSRYLGKVRVARIDVSTYAAPVLESFTDIDGVLEDVTWDGAGAFVVLAQTPDYGAQSVVVAREAGDAIAAGPAHQLKGVFRGSGSVAHASEGLLYVAYASDRYSASADSIAIFALP